MRRFTLWLMLALLAGSASAQLRVKPRDIDTTSTLTWTFGGVTIGPSGALSWSALLNPARLSSDTPSNGDVLRWLTGGTLDWLSLGNAATKDVGTTTGTVAAGDHNHSGVYQPAGSYQAALNGTGFVKASGTTISYDNSTYEPADSDIQGHLAITSGNPHGTTAADVGAAPAAGLELIADSAHYNTIAGYRANGYTGDGITHETTGSTILGHEAGLALTNGTSEVFIGERTGWKTTTGGGNTGMGHGVLYENVGGANNTSIGYLSGRENTSGGNNTYLGVDAGHDNQTASNNVCIGAEAGEANLAAGQTFVGMQAGLVTTTGSLNTFVGYNSGISNVDGYQNAFLGYGAGNANTSGAGNTHVGAGAGIAGANAPVTDTFGTLVGYVAGRSVVSATALTNYTAIGYGAQVSKSNQVVIGNDNVTETVLKGAVLAAGGVTSSSIEPNDDPNTRGFLAWSGQLLDATLTSVLPTSYVYASKVWVPETIVATGLACFQTATLLATPDADEDNGMAVFDSAGTLIAKTVDCAGTDAGYGWAANANGLKKAPWSGGGTVTIPGGPGVYVYVAIVTNATTVPSFAFKGTLAGQLNAGLAAGASTCTLMSGIKVPVTTWAATANWLYTLVDAGTVQFWLAIY